MKTTKITILSCIVFFVLNGVCLAACPLSCGFYVEGNAGLTKVSNTNYGTGISLSNSGYGLNVNLGYKFMPFFAAEVGVTKYTDVKIKSSSGGSATSSNGAVDLAGKAILPLGFTGTELFAKLGVAAVSSKIDLNKNTNGITVSNGTHTGTNYYVGAGAEYFFTSNTLVVGQWAHAQGSKTTGAYDLYTIGAAYILG